MSEMTLEQANELAAELDLIGHGFEHEIDLATEDIEEDAPDDPLDETGQMARDRDTCYRAAKAIRLHAATLTAAQARIAELEGEMDRAVMDIGTLMQTMYDIYDGSGSQDATFKENTLDLAAHRLAGRGLDSKAAIGTVQAFADLMPAPHQEAPDA